MRQRTLRSLLAERVVFKGAVLRKIKSRIYPAGLVLAVLLGVSGCGPDTIDVERAARPAAIGQALPFTVLLTDAQERDPEFIHYARIVVARLEAHGLVAAADAHQARYAVLLDQHGSGPVVFDDAPVAAGGDFGTHGDMGGPGAGIGGPGMGGAGMGGMGGMGGGGISGPGGMGGGRGANFGDTGSESHDHVARSVSGSGNTSFRIAIFDLSKPLSPDEKVFDAEAWAKAPHEASDTVVAAMIEAALKDFPGKPQENFSVPVPPKGKGHEG
jgi:hypothetical protein